MGKAQATYQIQPAKFPSGVPELDALASFPGIHCLSGGSHVSNAYGSCFVGVADETGIECAQNGEAYDPFNGTVGPFDYAMVTLTVSIADPRWITAAFEKAVDDIKIALTASSGQFDDDLPDWFDSIGFETADIPSEETKFRRTLKVWWRAQ